MKKLQNLVLVSVGLLFLGVGIGLLLFGRSQKKKHRVANGTAREESDGSVVWIGMGILAVLCGASAVAVVFLRTEEWAYDKVDQKVIAGHRGRQDVFDLVRAFS